MTVCEHCKGPLKPLWTSWFCPNECDRRPKASPTIDWEELIEIDGIRYKVLVFDLGSPEPDIPRGARCAWLTGLRLPADAIRGGGFVYLDQKVSYGRSWWKKNNSDYKFAMAVPE